MEFYTVKPKELFLRVIFGFIIYEYQFAKYRKTSDKVFAIWIILGV